MEMLTHFRTIEELVKMMDREKVLFRDMFERRKSLAYRTDFAMEVVDYKRERIQYLIEHGVIHENGDFLEMEDVYVQFLEEVLDMNEEISVASVREHIDALRENIDYYLTETNEHRKAQYQSNVRKMLRRIGHPHFPHGVLQAPGGALIIFDPGRHRAAPVHGVPRPLQRTARQVPFTPQRHPFPASPHRPHPQIPSWL